MQVPWFKCLNFNDWRCHPNSYEIILFLWKISEIPIDLSSFIRDTLFERVSQLGIFKETTETSLLKKRHGAGFFPKALTEYSTAAIWDTFNVKAPRQKFKKKIDNFYSRSDKTHLTSADTPNIIEESFGCIIKQFDGPTLVLPVHPVHSASINHNLDLGTKEAPRNLYRGSAFLNNVSQSPSTLSRPLIQASIYMYLVTTLLGTSTTYNCVEASIVYVSKTKCNIETLAVHTSQLSRSATLPFQAQVGSHR